ncbi:MAG: prepilin-type N-terminal cleavage/methylation domain-containing protein [Oribacterium sp.]|nr:prepilin-type N-terminal cleavage/methylation domain-containing protein [Oribacterium sp.]
MFKKLNKKGFTLAELLVVVAIIGVLVAISIPIFTSQLEKAREATDAANIRAAYAEVAADALDEATLATAKTGITVDLKQQTDGWGTTPDIGGIANADITGTPKKDGTCLVKWDDTKNVITLTYSA